MSVKVEKTENKNEVKLEIKVEAKVFDAAMKDVFNKNAKYFNIPGFRKGKAPMNIVEKYYGEEIFYEDTFNQVATEAYDEAIKSEKLDVVSRPEIEIKEIGKGKELVFTAIVNTKPEIKLGKFKGIEVEKTKYKVTAADVDAELNQMAERNSRMVSVSDRAAKKGDIAVIDFKGSVDGVEFEGGKAENYDLELGSGSFIPGFEDQVIGMKIDETKDVKVKFPANYPEKKLADKDAVFVVVLHEIKVKELPKLDDEFAKDVSEFDTLKELKADIKAKKEEQNADKAKKEVEDKAVKAVAEDAKVEIPEGMVELEIDNMEEDINRNLSYQGFNIDQYLQMLGKTKADFRKESKEPAIQNIKIRLALEAVAEEAKVKVDAKDIDAKVAELAQAYGKKEDELKANEALIENLKSSLKAEKAVEFIVENAKVKEVEPKEEKEEKPAKKTAKKEEKEDSAKKTTKKSTKADK